MSLTYATARRAPLALREVGPSPPQAPRLLDRVREAVRVFLYRDVLQQDLPWLDDVVRAKRPVRLPVVLTRDEVRAVIRQLRGTTRSASDLAMSGVYSRSVSPGAAYSQAMRSAGCPTSLVPRDDRPTVLACREPLGPPRYPVQATNSSGFTAARGEGPHREGRREKA